MKIINGKEIAEKIKDNIVAEVLALKGERPNLAIILLGEREDSQLYVKLKEQEAKKVGIDSHLYKCADNINEPEVIDMINFLNQDDSIDGILIQLPLPVGFDTDKIISTIKPEKDVDGFHPENLKLLEKVKERESILPPLIKVVLEIINTIQCDLQGKKICLIVNSDIFGRSMKLALSGRGADVEVVQIDDKNFSSKTSQADVLITAIGKPQYIKKNMIKEGAVIIDIGITKVGEKTLGDVDFEDVKDKVGYITPVPGGVGPITIAMALENTLELFKKRKGIK